MIDLPCRPQSYTMAGLLYKLRLVKWLQVHAAGDFKHSRHDEESGVSAPSTSFVHVCYGRSMASTRSTVIHLVTHRRQVSSVIASFYSMHIFSTATSRSPI